MRNFKKILSLVLCMAMMLSVMVVGAGAAFSDQNQIKNTEAVDMCVALNIINGYNDGTFRPEGTITRAEACKMICIALNGGKEPVLGTSASASFTDTKGHWAEQYIESCVAQGIVAGVGGGKFAPNATVTGSQFAKMLLIALGYNADNEGYVGAAWEINVNVQATAKGLYEDLEGMDPSVALTRDNAAQMVWNALQAYTVEYDYTLVSNNGTLTSQVVVKDTTKTMLYAEYKGIILETTLEDASYNSDKGEWTYTVGDGVAFGSGEDVDYEDTFTGDVDYCNLYQQAVKVVYTVKNGSVDKFLGMVSDASIVVEGVIGDIDDVAEADKEVTINDVDYKLDKDLKGSVPVVSYLAGDDTTLADADLCGAFAFWAIDNNDDGRIDVIVYLPFTVGQIDYLSSTSITVTGVGSEDLDDVNLYDGADEDDWVIVTAAENTNDETMAIAKAEIVSGEVARVKSDTNGITDVQVDGTWYEVAENNGDTIKVNDSYDLTVVNGYVFNADKTAGNVSASNVLYLDKVAALTSGLADGVEAKVYFTDGTAKTVTITEITVDGEDYDIVNDNATADEDEMKASDAADELDVDTLYTYSEKNGEYSVEAISSDNIGSYDGYYSVDSTTIKDGKTSDKARFAEDAVIFVNDDDGISVVTGKTVNTWKEIDADSVIGLYDKSNGNKYIAIGAIDLGDATAKTDAAVYGFVTSGISTDDDYTYFTMWNGTESVEVKVETDDLDVTVAKYSFVSFDWVDEATGEADGEGFVVKTASVDAVAITAYVTDDSISFSGNVNYDFADDYFVIGVDTKNGTGAGAKLAVAKDCQGTDDHAGSGQYANAIYFTVQDGNDTVVEAVFVDVNGMMYTGKNGDKLCTCEN